MPAPAEKLKNKDEAIEFIEIQIEAEAATIEVVKDATGDGYVGKFGSHPD